jgi:hypothetical protein
VPYADLKHYMGARSVLSRILFNEFELLEKKGLEANAA